MKRFLKNNKGFTLLETMVAAGIAGGIGLLAYTLLSTSTKTVNTTKAFHETSFLKNQVIAYISMPENCMLNFGDKVIGTVATPTVYPSLKRKMANGTSPDFIVKNKTYGQNANSNVLTVTDIKTFLSPDKSNIMNLQVDYQILANMKVDTTRKTDSFIVEVYIGKDPVTPTKVESCFTDTAKMIREAVRLSCNPSSTTNGTVTYNGSVGPYGECVHHRIEVKNEAGAIMTTQICPPNQFLVKTDTTAGTAGSTTTPGKINFECKTLTLNTSCATGSYLKEIDASGNAVCVTIASLLATMPAGTVISTTTGGYAAQDLNCGTGEVLRTFNTSGKGCVARTAANTCGANQYVDSISSSGAVTCKPVTKTATTCPGGQFVRSVSANGAITSCGALTLPGSCPGSNQVVIALDSNGNASCGTNY